MSRRGREHHAAPAAQPAGDFAEFVEQLPTPDVDNEPSPTLVELISSGIRAANKVARYGDAQVLSDISIRVGALRLALPGAIATADDELRAALEHLSSLI